MTTISNATIAPQQNDLWAEAKREPSSIESPPLVRTPSTTVTLTDKNLIDTDFYSQLEQRIANNAQQKWELPLSDYASNLMARNFNGHSNANRFLGLGGAMLERFKSPPADFKQSVTEIGPQATKAAIDLEKGTINLNIKTQSGVSIELKLSNQGDRLAAEVKTNGELTAAEQTAMSQLAKGFETTIQNLLAKPPHAEIDALMKFDTTQLAALDLTTNFANKNGETMAFELHANENHREIQLQTPQGKMSVNVNFQQAAALGNAQQREKAISQYLKQFDHAGERGKPNAEMLSLFKTVFSGLHKNHPSDAIALLNAPPQAKALNDLEQAVLTGLGDFQADLTMKPTSPNPRKTLEMDHFSFQLKQKTSILGKTSITQK
ncbi:hypothetical protein [Deefgea piscis]|uniref:hypothetical protein n=1 Tax=Deefgea piscis TaxID=2739061 RepID=UPI001C7FCB54|nr:hypothetical protein [Deefgea piscis]QZA82579.1 hypothetical protein K4H25_08095 [Deefgea piscis]